LIKITRPLAKAILSIEGDVVEKSSALYAVEQGFSECLREIQTFEMKSEVKSEVKGKLTEVSLIKSNITYRLYLENREASKVCKVQFLLVDSPFGSGSQRKFIAAK